MKRGSEAGGVLGCLSRAAGVMLKELYVFSVWGRHSAAVR